MSVDGLAALVGRSDLGEARLVTLENPRVVHHLTEIANASVIQQFAHVVNCDLRSRRFKARGGHA